jgi:hypothetical protein
MGKMLNKLLSLFIFDFFKRPVLLKTTYKIHIRIKEARTVTRPDDTFRHPYRAVTDLKGQCHEIFCFCFFS